MQERLFFPGESGGGLVRAVPSKVFSKTALLCMPFYVPHVPPIS